MNNSQGLSFISSCLGTSCQLKDTPLHFSLGYGCFDLLYITRETQCGSCKNVLGKIISITLTNCLWKYEGTTIQQQEVKSKTHLSTSEMIHIPNKYFLWETLLFYAWSPIQATYPLIQRIDASTQTNDHITSTIIAALTEEAQYYRNKYRNSKDKARNHR